MGKLSSLKQGLRYFFRTNTWGRRFAAEVLTHRAVVGNPLYQQAYSAWIKREAHRMASQPPQVIHIENTNYCNARCIMCSHGAMTRPKGFMSMDLYRKVISEAAELGVPKVTVQFFGEPLLDKHLFERIRLARQAGLETEINTNASLLTAEASVRLIESGLDELHISFDGFTRATYERIRVGLDFDKVVANIEGFLGLKRRTGSPRPKVFLTFVAFETNRHEAKAFLNHWGHRVDHVIISNARNWAGQKHVKGTGKFCQEHLPTVPCAVLWKQLVALVDGRVTVCCDDYDGKLALGDLNRQTLGEIWNGSKLRKLRDLHIAGQGDKIPLCRSCTQYTVWF